MGRLMYSGWIVCYHSLYSCYLYVVLKYNGPVHSTLLIFQKDHHYVLNRFVCVGEYLLADLANSSSKLSVENRASQCHGISWCPDPLLMRPRHFDRSCAVCSLRNKMTCAMKLDYSEKEVRSVNLTHSSSPNSAPRQDTGQDVWSWV